MIFIILVYENLFLYIYFVFQVTIDVYYIIAAARDIIPWRLNSV